MERAAAGVAIPSGTKAGKGAHGCVGSWLAHMELQVALGTVAERFPATELAVQELVRSSNVIRGPQELVLHLKTAA